MKEKLRSHRIIVAVTLLVIGGLVLAGTFVRAQSPAGKSLYARLGGYDAIAAVTDDFVGRLASDPQLGKFFVGHSQASLRRIRQLVVDQLCEATGGPCYYIGRDMRTSHKGLGITEADWSVTVKHLGASLDKFKVGAQERGELVAALTKIKGDIVEKP
jgi:hemoglobin